MVFDEFIAYDHLHDKIILVALAEKEEDAIPVLDRMEREIKTSVPEEHYALQPTKKFSLLQI